jgi:hypothetical protein
MVEGVQAAAGDPLFVGCVTVVVPEPELELPHPARTDAVVASRMAAVVARFTGTSFGLLTSTSHPVMRGCRP